MGLLDTAEPCLLWGWEVLAPLTKGRQDSAPMCLSTPARGQCPPRLLSSNQTLCKISSTLKEESKGAVHVGMSFSPQTLADFH